MPEAFVLQTTGSVENILWKVKTNDLLPCCLHFVQIIIVSYVSVIWYSEFTYLCSNYFYAGIESESSAFICFVLFV